MPKRSIAARLQGIWYRPAPPPWPLRLLSWPFALAARLRRAAYVRGWLRVHRVARPVIVVGNLSVGGTGKTPLVIWLVEQLRAAGCNAGVVLRGYGGKVAGAQAVLAVQSDSDPARVGDEALLIAQRTGAPVVVGRDRVRAAQQLVRAGVDVIVADDGLQHLRLGRDYEIAVVDAARGMGNGHLLPAGPLREPSWRLATVGAVVLNGEGGTRSLPAIPAAVISMRLVGEQLRSLSGQGDTLPLNRFRGRRVHAVAGIGDPGRFFALLQSAGLQVISHPFPDHHRYRGTELQFGDGLPVLMTEKDAVKCRGFAGADRWYLPVAASFAPEQSAALLARIQPVLKC